MYSMPQHAVMKGYWKEEAATQSIIKGGWVYTGDLGYQDEDSYIYLSGRAKDYSSLAVLIAIIIALATWLTILWPLIG
mgnify:CR=1 FL=1